MTEEMGWLFIVVKLKIIFNFICQESALFFAMKGAHDFLQSKEEKKTGGNGAGSSSLDCLPQRGKNLKPTGWVEVYVPL